MWREDRIDARLDQHDDGVLFIGGTYERPCLSWSTLTRALGVRHHHSVGLRLILILAHLSLVGTLAPLSDGSLARDNGSSRSPWGLIIQKPPGTEASAAEVGDLLTIVGWSPASFKGVRYQLCQKRPTGLVCIPGPMPKQDLGYVLKGRVQSLGTWRVTRLSGVAGVLKISLRVERRLRASDSVGLG